MNQLTCTLCSKSWKVAYIGDLRREQHEHDLADHPELIQRQDALFREAQALMSKAGSARDSDDTCAFCGKQIADRREHERTTHAAENARTEQITEALKSLDRHWEIQRT
ncbi:MAG: hypothetical protein ABI577_06185 [bacterium]